MITYVDFSLFESPAKVLVNTVNTVGVMGKGIAKDFKSLYPDMFSRYQRLCEEHMFNIGQLWLYKTPHKWVLNFPTKKHWRYPSKPEYVEAGLEKFARIYQDARITSISFPQLGCGNGGLDWSTQVKPLMERHLKSLPIEIFVHLSAPVLPSKPEHQSPAETLNWMRAQPRAMAFGQVWSDLVATIEADGTFVINDGKETYEVGIFDDADGGGMEIRGISEPISIHKDQMLDLWQQIRDLGVCIPDIMPRGLDEHSDYVLPLLTRLPYLEPIHQSRSANRLTRRHSGLLLKSEPPGQELTGLPSPQLKLL